MKYIQYQIYTKVNVGTENEPAYEDVFTEKDMTWSEENEEIARKEAYNGEIEFFDDEELESSANPTQLDIIEAQVTYTAMMTDTLLEV